MAPQLGDSVFAKRLSVTQLLKKHTTVLRRESLRSMVSSKRSPIGSFLFVGGVDDDVGDREGTAAAFVLPSGVASQRSATRNDELEPISATTEALTASSKTMSAPSEAKAETPHEGEGSPLLVVITPTYARPTNKPPPQANALLRMLNAMCQSSRQNILWILVIEFGDADPAPKLPRCRSISSISRKVWMKAISRTKLPHRQVKIQSGL